MSEGLGKQSALLLRLSKVLRVIFMQISKHSVRTLEKGTSGYCEFTVVPDDLEKDQKNRARGNTLFLFDCLIGNTVVAESATFMNFAEQMTLQEWHLAQAGCEATVDRKLAQVAVKRPGYGTEEA
ncbi:hypothetical protein BKA70DRAFT_1214067 [Coprinopsis sp. MPI-PUGE-AT-0042]|nr:hypothetical protein BKA70DRAFT_1214067 [Coprinopsis sp. MPI-PUGE-AT-0042]